MLRSVLFCVSPKMWSFRFEPFISLDESKNREKNGFGLGLSIARNLAQNNGYRLLLDEHYKRGCRFILKKI